MNGSILGFDFEFENESGHTTTVAGFHCDLVLACSDKLTSVQLFDGILPIGTIADGFAIDPNGRFVVAGGIQAGRANGFFGSLWHELELMPQIERVVG